jgi:hypothetical protein
MCGFAWFLTGLERSSRFASLSFSALHRCRNHLHRIALVKILSIRQPWASLIVSGAKDVENRTWPTRYRGRILVHASQRADDICSDDIERRFGLSLPAELPLGGIVGMTEIVDCVKSHASKWYARDHWAFVLANSRQLPFVKWKGALMLRNAPAELLELLNLDRPSTTRTALIAAE